MSVTKEKILETALTLFAREGFAGTSMADIAGELGITKGALYRHYAGKRDIFESILRRMEERDAENAERHDVPVEPIEQGASAYGDTEIDSVIAYSEAMFRYWTEDAFASAFRRMLTLEQYRDCEMARLYSQYITGGPLKYMADLFREMTARGCWREDDPMQLALEFYGPMTLLMAVADGPDGGNAVELLRAHLRRFIERHRA
ncbi:MAG: helix-turn-helix domain-containing protein [Eubacteriales bacterium]|nr:helix-turn-helix domain-containing protein [Eubacteriales bacterium]